jgi:hypothetical protein
MYASNTYVIRVSTDDDAVALRRLAQLDSKAPLDGAVLIGEIAGTPVAALSLTDDRVVADPFVPTAHLLASLRVRANGLRAVERTPSLRERLRDAVPAVARPGAARSGA